METLEYVKFDQTQGIKNDVINLSECQLCNLVFFLVDFEHVFASCFWYPNFLNFNCFWYPLAQQAVQNPQKKHQINSKDLASGIFYLVFSSECYTKLCNWKLMLKLIYVNNNFCNLFIWSSRFIICKDVKISLLEKSLF